MILVAVEGIIGAGKTTLAENIEIELKKMGRARALLIPEPTQENTSWLARYYTDPQRWAFHTQLAMLVGRSSMLRWAINSSGIADIIIFDRSIVGDKMFAHANHKIGNLSDDEMTLYSLIHQNLLGSDTPVDYIIHVDTPVDDAMISVFERARIGEGVGVTKEYQSLLQEGLKSTLEDQSCPLLVVERLPLGAAYDLQVNRIAARLCDIHQAQKLLPLPPP